MAHASVTRRGTENAPPTGPGRIRLIISRRAATADARSRRPHEILVDILGATAGSTFKRGRTFARIEVAAALYGILI
jgi:hypothetical protein